MFSTRTHMGLTIQQKLDILDELKTKKRAEIAQAYGCNQTTIGRIVKAEARIREIALRHGNLGSFRKRKSAYGDLNAAVSKWFTEQQANGVVVTGPQILEKARVFGQIMDINFQPSNGWLGRWKRAENVSFRKIQGEKKSSDFSGRSQRIADICLDAISGYEARNIFNAGEAGLLYKALASNGKMLQKQPRITLVFLCNADSSDKFVFSIGKLAEPRSFDRVCKMPVKYFSNSNAWMSSEIWTEIMVDFDNEMFSQNRNILLFADNAYCHKLIEGTRLRCIKIIFLSPNIQPLNQGIIRNFKILYRQLIVCRQLAARKDGKTMIELSKSLDLLRALHMVKRAWQLVEPKSIANCFRKAGFAVMQIGLEAIQEDNELPKIPVGISVDEFTKLVDCDNQLPCYGEIGSGDIGQFRECLSDDDDEERKMPSSTEIFNALDVLRNAVETSGTNFENFYTFEEEMHALIAVTPRHSC